MLNEERNTCVSSLDQLPPCPSPPLTGERHKRIRREQVTALLTPEHPDVVAKFRQRLDDSFVDDNRNVSAAEHPAQPRVGSP